LFVDLVGEQLLEQVLEGVLGDFGLEDFHDLLAEELLLGAFGVAGGLDLELVAAGEGDGEETDEVAILGLCLNESLDKGVPLLDEGAELVADDIHAVEVGVHIETFDFLALELDLSPCHLVGVTIEFTKGDGENATTQAVGGDLLKRLETR